MKADLIKHLESPGALSIGDIFLRLFAAFVISCVIYISYVISHKGTIYSKKFNVSLVMLTILTSMVMTVIGNNVALSLGMVGALSIVRFRTAIKDSRDTTYIFWAIIVGICTGVGDYIVAGIGSVVVFITMLVLGAIKNDGRILIIVKATLNNETKIKEIIYEYFSGKAILKVMNTTEDNIEFIYEVSKKDVNSVLKTKDSLVQKLYKLKGVEYVNLVSQNDEISG